METNEPIPQSEITPASGSFASRIRTNSYLWVLPILAAVLVPVLIIQAYATSGMTISIRFASGDGLRPGDAVNFRGVQVGKVRTVELASDHHNVQVTVELERSAVALAVEGARFWIVRPELSLSRVAGLDTLIGPRYIEIDSPRVPPGGNAPTVREFVGLDRPPRLNIPGAEPGSLAVLLIAPRPGSISPGSPVTFRDVRVGSIGAVELAADARSVEIVAVIDAAFTHLVRANSRFWNVSGIGLDLGFVGGLKLKAQSLETVMSGGIAFATPQDAAEQAQVGHRFELAETPESSWLKWDPVLLPEAKRAASPAASSSK